MKDPFQMFRDKFGVPVVKSEIHELVSKNTITGEQLVFALRFDKSLQDVKFVNIDQLVEAQNEIKSLNARISLYEFDAIQKNKKAIEVIGNLERQLTIAEDKQEATEG